MSEDEVKKAAKILSQLGGKARKAQNPDYSTMGKKGMASRWKDHKKKEKKKSDN